MLICNIGCLICVFSAFQSDASLWFRGDYLVCKDLDGGGEAGDAGGAGDEHGETEKPPGDNQAWNIKIYEVEWL